MNDTPELFIDSRNQLGEGPLWHPDRRRLYWFDINNRTLFGAGTDGAIVDRFIFEQSVSAAGIIDEGALALAASENFLRLDLRTGETAFIAELEPDKPGSRSNDGRVNPAGGFWIGSMSRAGDKAGVGSLHQFRAGALETLLTDINVPNATCFSPDGRTAYFTGQRSDPGVIKRCTIDPDTGLPAGPWEPFATIAPPAQPDGAVVDSEGYLWNAVWDGGRVVRYASDGTVDRIVELPVSRVTCPCFGGDDLKTLFFTTARAGLSEDELKRQPLAGGVFAMRVDVPGQAETRLVL